MVPFLRVAMASWMCGTALFSALPLRAQPGADLSSRLQQALNADHLVIAGAALMIEQPQLTADKLANTINGLDRDTLLAMSEKARGQATPDADKVVAEAIKQLT